MGDTLANRLSSRALTYLIHHIFLPPELPQEDDYCSEDELTLLNITLAALRKFQSYVSGIQNDAIGSAVATITSLMSVRDSEDAVSKRKLESALQNLGRIGGHINTILPFILLSRARQKPNNSASHTSPECCSHDQ